MRTIRGLDRFELGLLALMGVLSLWVAGSDVVVALSRGLRWTHTDGFFPADQLQYLAWIQSSASHGLISDLYVLRSTPADYLQPAIMLSALLVRLGMASWLALMLWKPAAVLAFFLAARALTADCLERTFDRRAALVLALLYCCVSDVNGSLGVIGDMMPMWQSWGYPFGLLGVALITVALLRYARARGTGAVAWTPGLLGGLAGLLHPWQGELMFVVLVIAELACLRPGARWAPEGVRRPGARLAGLTLTLVAAPLLYYFALGHLDPVWRMGQAQARHGFSALAVLIGAAPLLLVALLGYRGRPASFVELALRAWVPATIVIWVFSVTALGATPLHAVNGLTLPLAVLAVLGVRRAGLDRLGRARVLACGAVALAVVPGTAYTMAYAHTFTDPQPGNANFITAADARALDWLHADRMPGGVLSADHLGSAVPGITGRRSYVGNCLWSQPDCPGRKARARALLDGRLGAAAARRVVRGSGARFVLGGCSEPPGPVTRELSGAVAAIHRFGCATVWQLRPSAAVGHG